MPKENLNVPPSKTPGNMGADKTSNMSSPHTSKGGFGNSLDHKRQLIEEEKNKNKK